MHVSPARTLETPPKCRRASLLCRCGAGAPWDRAEEVQVVTLAWAVTLAHY